MRIILLAILFLLNINVFAQNESERQECRRSTSTEIIADCIEKGIYDPCDDAGGKWGDSQCGWAHALVAERRIENAMKEIRSKSFRAKFKNPDELNNILWSQRNWELYRDQFCLFKNSALDNENVFNGEKLGYCHRRLDEERAKELENLIVIKK